MKQLYTTCPTSAEIESILLSVTGDDEQERLAAHLDGCATCRAVADRLSQQATLESDLHWAATVRAGTPVDVQEPLRRLSEILPEYEILKEIGRGGMGIVYKARQPKLNRFVAIKVLPALLGVVRPEAKARFRREAELAANLEHTNIISVYDYGEADGTLYYSMQLILGRSLRAILSEIEAAGAVDTILGHHIERREAAQAEQPSRGGAVDSRSGSASGASQAYFRTVAHWVAEVAEALQCAHEHGVIHRDIKPSNLLLADDGRLMISDFGLARPSDAQSLTASNSLLGTCRYMAPEQVESEGTTVDHQVDVYALGATLYELLCFRPMYAATDDRLILEQIRHNEPTPPHRLAPHVPRALETICLKAVERDRSARYATAGEFAEDLRRWLLDLPIQARPQTVAERATRFVRRRKLPLALTVTTVLFATLAAAMYQAYTHSSQAADAARLEASGNHARLLVQEAKALVDGEDYPAALERLDTALQFDAGALDALRLKVRVLDRRDLDGEATALIARILSEHPDDWRTHYLAGLRAGGCQSTRLPIPENAPRLGVSDDALASTGRLAAHLEVVRRARPDSAEALCLASLAETDDRTALRLLDRAVAANPDLSDVWVQRALRLGCAGDNEAALHAIDGAIARNHGGGRVHGLRAITLYHLRRYEEAVAALTEAIRRSPNNVDWWYDRAVAHSYLGLHAETVSDATEAIRLDPDYSFAYTARARGLVGLNQPAAALADFNRAAELNPSIADVFVERGLLYWSAGRFAESLADAQRVIELEPDQARGYQRRAQSYFKMGRFDEAMADLDTAELVLPNHESNARLRGGFNYFAKRYDEAIAAFSRGIELEPGIHINYQYRARCYVALGRFQEALSDLTYWTTLPDLPEIAHLRRGIIYERLGETRLALADYARAAAANPAVADYARLWSHILVRATDHDTDADLILAKVPAEGWCGEIAALLRGDATPEHLITRASSPGQRLEALYYAGVRYALDGREEDARAVLTECVSQDNAEVLETDLAMVWLARLSSADP